ncbi:MAG: GyrI-like domain-containing protein [Devosia sp.]
MAIRGVLIATAKPRLLASVRRQARPETIGTLIRTSGVWELMKTRNIKSTGHNVVVYRDEPGAHLMSTPQGIPVDIGAEIAEPFTGDAELTCTTTPPGRFISVLHAGSYDRLGEAHDTLIQFARTERLQLAGPYWEFYGHWSDDPAQLETTVCYAVA